MISQVLIIGVLLLLPLATTQETSFTQNGLKSGSNVAPPKSEDKPVFKRSSYVQQHDPYSIAVKNICLQQNKCRRYPLHFYKGLNYKPKQFIRYINYPVGSSQFHCTCKKSKVKSYKEEYLRTGLDEISEHDKFDFKKDAPLVINSKHDYTSQGDTNIKELGKWGKGTFSIDRNGFPWIGQQLPETENNDYSFHGYIPQNKFQVVTESYKTDKEEIRNDSPILKYNVNLSDFKLEPLQSHRVSQDVPYGTDIKPLSSIHGTIESVDTYSYGDEISPMINHSDSKDANDLENVSPPSTHFDTKGSINIYSNSYEIPSKHSDTEDKTIIFGYGNPNGTPKYTKNILNDPGKILPLDPPSVEKMQVYGYGVKKTPLISYPDPEEYLEIFGYKQSDRTPKHPGMSPSDKKSDEIFSQNKGLDPSNIKKEDGHTHKYSDPYEYVTDPDSHGTDTQNVDGYSTRPGLPTTTTQLLPGSVQPSTHGTRVFDDYGVGTSQSQGSTQNLPGAPQLIAGKYSDPYGYDTDPDSYGTDTQNVDGYPTRPGFPTTTTQLLPGSVQPSTHGTRVVDDSGIGTSQSQGSTQNLPGAPQLIAGKYPDPYGYDTDPDSYGTDTQNVDGYPTRPGFSTTTTQLLPGSVQPSTHGTRVVDDSGVGTSRSQGSTQNLPGAPQLIAGKYPDPYGYDTYPDSYDTDTQNVDGYPTRPGFPTTTTQLLPGSVQPSTHGTRVVDDYEVGTSQSQGSTQNLPGAPQLIAGKYSDPYGYDTDPDSYGTDTQNVDGYPTRPGYPTTTTQLLPGSVQPSTQGTRVVDDYEVGTSQSQGSTQNLPGAPQLIAGKYPDPYGYDTYPDSYGTDTQNVDGYPTRPGFSTTTTQLLPGSVQPSTHGTRVVDDSGVGTSQSQGSTQNLPGAPQLIAGKYSDPYGYDTDPDSYGTDTQNVDGYPTRPGYPTTTTQLLPGSVQPSTHGTRVVDDSGVGTSQSQGSTQNLPGAPQLIAGKYPDPYGYDTDPDSYDTDTQNVDGYPTRPGFPTTTTQLLPGSVQPSIHGTRVVDDCGVGTPQAQGRTQNLPGAPQLIAGKYPDPYGYDTDPDSYGTDTQNVDGYPTRPGFYTTKTQLLPGSVQPSTHGTRVVDDSGIGTSQSQGSTQNLPGAPQLIAGKYPDPYGYDTDPDSYGTDTQNVDGYPTRPGFSTTTTQLLPGSVQPSTHGTRVVDDSGVGTSQSQGSTQNLPGAPQLIAGKYPDPYGYDTDPDSYDTDTQNVDGYPTRPGFPTTTTQLLPGSVQPSTHGTRVVDDYEVGTSQSQGSTQNLPGAPQLIAGKYPDPYGYDTDPDSYGTDTQNVDGYPTRPGFSTTKTQLLPGSVQPSTHGTRVVDDSGVGTSQSQGSTQNLPGAPQLIAGKYPDPYGYDTDPDSYGTDTQHADGYPTRPGFPTTTTQLLPGSVQPSTHGTRVVDDCGVGTPQAQGSSQNLPGAPQLIAGKYPDPYGYDTDPDSYGTDTQHVDGYPTRPGFPTTTTQLLPGSVQPSTHGIRVVDDSGVGTSQSQGSTQNLPGAPQLIAGKYPDPYGYDTDPDSYDTDTQNVDGYPTRPGFPTTTTQLLPGSVQPSTHGTRVVDDYEVGTSQSQGSTQNLPGAPQLIAGKYPDPYGYDTDPDSYGTDTQNVDGYPTRPGFSTTKTQLLPGSVQPSTHGTRVVDDSGVGTSQSQGSTQNLPGAPQLIAGKYPDPYGYDTDPDSYGTDTQHADGYPTRPGFPTTTTQLLPGSVQPSTHGTRVVDDCGVGTPQAQGSSQNLPGAPQLIAGKYPDPYGYDTDPDSYGTDTQHVDGYPTRPGFPTTTTQLLPGSVQPSTHGIRVVDDSGVGTSQSQGSTQNLPGAPQLIAGKYPDPYGYDTGPDSYDTDTHNVVGYPTRPGFPTTTTQLLPGSVQPSTQGTRVVDDYEVGTPQVPERTQNLPGAPQLNAGKYPDPYGYDTDPDSYGTDTQNVDGCPTRPGFPTTTTQLLPGSVQPSTHSIRLVDDSGVGTSQSQGSTQNLPGAPQLIARKHPDPYGYDTDPDSYGTDTQNVYGYPTRPGFSTTTTQLLPGSVQPSTHGTRVVDDSGVGTSQSQGSTQYLPGAPQLIAGTHPDPYGYDTDPDSYGTDTQHVDGYPTRPGFPTTTTQLLPGSVQPSTHGTRVVDDSGVGTPQAPGSTQILPGAPQLNAGKYPDPYGYDTDPDSYGTDTQNVDGYPTRLGFPTTTTQLLPGSVQPSTHGTQLVDDSGVGTPQALGSTQNLPGAPQLNAGKYPDPYGFDTDPDSYGTDTQNGDGYSTRPGFPTTSTQQIPGSVYPSIHRTRVDSGVGTPHSQGITQISPGTSQMIARIKPDQYGYDTEPDSYVTDTQNIDGYSPRHGLPITTTQLQPENVYPSIHCTEGADYRVGNPTSQVSAENHPRKSVSVDLISPHQSEYETTPDLYVKTTSSDGYALRSTSPTITTQQGAVHPQTYGTPVVGDSRIGMTVPRDSDQNLSGTPNSVSVTSFYPSEYETKPESHVTSSDVGHSRRPELSTTTTQHPGSVYPTTYGTRIYDSGIGTTEPQVENKDSLVSIDRNQQETLLDRREHNENLVYFHSHNKHSMPGPRKTSHYLTVNSPTADFVNKTPSYHKQSDTSLQESHPGFANTGQQNFRKSSNGENRSLDSSSAISDNEERRDEYSDDKVMSFYDGCVMTTSQFQDIVDSMKHPEECVLTVPHLFSGPLDKFSHVMKSFPSSVNSDEGFVQLPSGLLVPYHCFDYITFIHQSGSGSEPTGALLSTGEYIDPRTVANIVASANTPHKNFIITTNNEVVPYEIYNTYINSLSREDKKLIKVLVPNLKFPIPYLIFKEIYDKYTSESVCNDSSEDKVKLIGSDTEISLKEFLSVISNLYVLNQATVTLPSKNTMSLTNFIQLSRILGDEYTKYCLVNIPNTDYSIPFLIFKEIYSTYFNKNSPDLSKDTNVNLNLSVSEDYPHSSDVEVFNVDSDITIENQSSPSKSCRNTRHNTVQWTPNEKEKEIQFVPDGQHTYLELGRNCYSCPS